MIFLFLRLMPFVLPVFYFAAIRLVFYFSTYWFWNLTAVVLINGLFFLALWLKKRNKTILVFGLYTLIFAVLGFFEVWTLSQPVPIAVFMLTWSLAYGLLLESLFHYFYQTPKRILFDLKNITAIFNVIIFFFLACLLFYASIFNSLNWWLMLLTYGLAAGFILFCFFYVRGFNLAVSGVSAGAISLVLIELMAAMFFWSTSFFVSAFTLAAAAYLSAMVSVSALNRRPDFGKIVFYSLLVFLTILAVFLTAQWI